MTVLIGSIRFYKMAQLSTKTRYAVRIMAYLARRSSDRPVRVAEISEAEGITADYAEQILSRLKSAGLVKSHRGIRGGFTLTHEPGRIAVADIVRVTEGEIALAPCSNGDCSLYSNCAVRSTWQKVNSAVAGILSETTLKTLADEAHILPRGEALSFDI